MATQTPFPLMPSKSTALRLRSFDEYVYTLSPDTVLYKYLDALCGTAGAGSLKNQIMLARMSASLQTIFFNELDYIFGKINFVARSPDESYPYQPLTDMLTADQWNEVRIKDAWFRARIGYTFQALNLGGTPNGIRMGIQAVLNSDCDIYEMWRYIDNFGLTEALGRAPDPARNEVVVVPHKMSISPPEIRLARDLLSRMCSVDTVVTVNTTGITILVPVPVAAAAASSTYYEVQKLVTATPVLALLPPAAQLPTPLLPSETWLYDAVFIPTRAPYVAFNMTSEFGYYYLTGGGRRSMIDSVTYGTLQPDGTVATCSNYQVFSTTGNYGPLTPWARADSPDNFPGGKYGIHPDRPPALNPDRTRYMFPYTSQEAYITAQTIVVVSQGGLAQTEGYQLPVTPQSATAMVFYPTYAIASYPPAQESTVSASYTARRLMRHSPYEVRDPVNFIRNT